jgi:hypothetical protein
MADRPAAVNPGGAIGDQMPAAAAGVPATAVAVLSSKAGNGSEKSGLVAWLC